ncbi:MAG: hypothetical protein ACLP9L_27295 [Thermoguttaceae bacterium]
MYDVVLVFIDGPADGQREPMKVNSLEPLPERIRSTVGDRKTPGKLQANVSVYELDHVNNDVNPPEWIYHEKKRIPGEKYRP